MDFPDADLHYRLLDHQLEKPGIVQQVSDLEHLASIAFGQYARNTRQVLAELYIPLHIEFHQDGSQYINAFRFKPGESYPVALFRYYRNSNNQKKISMIIFRSGTGLVFVVIYKRDVSENDWNNPKNVSKVYIDARGTFGKELDDAFEYYRLLEKWREEREKFDLERRKDEGFVEFA